MNLRKGDILICKEQYTDPNSAVVFIKGKQYKISKVEYDGNLEFAKVFGEQGLWKLLTTKVYQRGTNYLPDFFTILRQERKEKLEQIFLSR